MLFLLFLLFLLFGRRQIDFIFLLSEWNKEEENKTKLLTDAKLLTEKDLQQSQFSDEKATKDSNTELSLAEMEMIGAFLLFQAYLLSAGNIQVQVTWRGDRRLHARK